MKININGKNLEIKNQINILQACQRINIEIPTLCHLPYKEKRSVCRICSVEVSNVPHLLPACSTLVSDGMEIFTDSPRVKETRSVLMQFILSEHGKCGRTDCKIENLAKELVIPGFQGVPSLKKNFLTPEHYSSEYISVRPDYCIHCDRCIRSCEKGIIGRTGQGANLHMNFEKQTSIEDSDCIQCGDCIKACPAGTIQLFNR